MPAVPNEPLTVSAISLFLGSRSVAGCYSGTAKDSQDILEFSALTSVHPTDRETFAQPRGGSLRTDAQRQGAVPRCPNPARSCRAMERTASTKLAIRPVDCSASSSSVLSFIRKAIHRTASPKAFFGKSSRSETSALVSNPAPTSTGAIFQASLTPPSRSQAVSASSESSAQSSACQPKDSSKPRPLVRSTDPSIHAQACGATDGRPMAVKIDPGIDAQARWQ